MRYATALIVAGAVVLGAPDARAGSASGIVGETDGTLIGNIGDRLKVDAAANINRTDLTLSSATTSGSGATNDSAGLAQISALFHVTAISGTGAYAQFHLQFSDDGSTWTTQWDTPRITATGTYVLNAGRLAHTDYRYTYDIGGTTPSISATVTTALKMTQTQQNLQRFLYGDIDLSANGNMSSSFLAEDCGTISVMLARGSGGANATVQIYASNDAANWLPLSGNVTINASTSNGTTLAGYAYRYYSAQVTAHAGAGITADIQWRCH